jgi:hypothetical protein
MFEGAGLLICQINKDSTRLYASLVLRFKVQELLILFRCTFVSFSLFSWSQYVKYQKVLRT